MTNQTLSLKTAAHGAIRADSESPVMFERRLAWFFGVIGALLALWPVIVRGGRVPAVKDLVPWAIGIGLITVVLALIDQRRGVRISRPPASALGIVVAPMVLVLALVLPDITNPYYSAIGDEYSFWEMARNLANGRAVDPFTQNGVYGNHPTLSSLYQSAVMQVTGIDQFGWRSSSAVALAVAAGAAAVIGLMTGGPVAGVITGLIVAAAHPLLAYAHTGYNNIQAVPLSLLAIALGLAGRRTNSRALIFFAGIAAGLGWYTFYLSRVILPVLLFVLLAQSGRGGRLRDLGLALGGFLLAALPILAASKERVITAMLAETAAREGGVAEALLPRLVGGVSFTALAPFRGDHTSHYISGPLLDPVSGLFAALGLILGAVLFWRLPYRWAWVWLGVAILAGGATSQYTFPPNSRSFFLIPPLALFAGLFAGWLADRLTSWRAPRAVVPAVGIAVAGMVIAANLYRLQVETPNRLALSIESVLLSAIESENCRAQAAKPLILADNPEPVLEKAIDAYRWTSQVEIRKTPATVTARDLGLQRCLLAMGPSGSAAQTLEALARDTGTSDRLDWRTDGPGQRRALLLKWQPTTGATLPPDPVRPEPTRVPAGTAATATPAGYPFTRPPVAAREPATPTPEGYPFLPTPISGFVPTATPESYPVPPVPVRPPPAVTPEAYPPPIIVPIVPEAYPPAERR